VSHTRKIAYAKPSITQLEISYALDAVTNGWGENCYNYIEKFEKKFANYLRINYCIATSSCTGALHMGLAAIGIKPGDEVILADTNWIATASPIYHLGAKPIFVDIDFETWCIDPGKVEASITNKTKAILITHLYGNLCAVDELINLGIKYNIPIIEDCAEAIGSKYKGKFAGTFGLFSTFSFHGSKTVSTGEGGAFVTNDVDLYQKVLTLSNHGRNHLETRQFWPERVGFKYKMSNIQAAIGCGQLERIDELVSRKCEILDFYRKSLEEFPNLRINPVQIESESGAWMPTIVFSPESKVTSQSAKNAFARNNIDARNVFWPLSSLGIFGPSKNRNLQAENFSKYGLNLPSFHDMLIAEQEKVIQVIRNLLRG
jgi:perosamine synthetase